MGSLVGQGRSIGTVSTEGRDAPYNFVPARAVPEGLYGRGDEFQKKNTVYACLLPSFKG